MNNGENTEIICEQTFMIAKKSYILLCFQIFPLRKTIFFNEGYIDSRSFQKYSRTYPTNVQFSRRFKARENHVITTEVNHTTNHQHQLVLLLSNTNKGSFSFPSSLSMKKNKLS